MLAGRKLMLLSVLAPCLALAADPVSLAGRWAATFDTQIGVQKYVFAFTVTGEGVTGRATYEREQGQGEVELRDVKLSGDEVSFVEPLQADEQEILITYRGRISGDEMKLSRQVGEFATEELTAHRVPEDTSPKPAPAEPPPPAKPAEPTGAKPAA